MRKYIDPITGQDSVWLGIDEYSILRKSTVAKTVLGSCVSVIVYDQLKDYYGINHYLNPDSGKPLTDSLLHDLAQHGCKHLRALICGGANKESTHYRIGEANIKLAKKLLAALSIPIDKEDCGGSLGRSITVQFKNGLIQLDSHLHEEQSDPKVVNQELNSAVKNAFDTISKLIKKN